MASRTLRMVMEGDTRSAVKALDRVDSGIGRVGKSTAKAVMLVTGLGLALGGLAVGGALAAVKSYAQSGAELSRWNRQTGISIGLLSTFDHAARQHGHELEDLVDVQKEVAIRASDVAAGSQTYAEFFKELGINVQQYLALHPDEQIGLLADRLLSVEDATRRQVIADELASDAGGRFLQVLGGMAGGLEGARREAERLGVVMTEKDAVAAEELSLQVAHLGARFTALKFNIARQVVPALLELTNWLGPRLTRAGVWLSDILEGRVLPALRWLIDQVSAIAVPWLDALGRIVDEARDRFEKLGPKIRDALAWIVDNQDALVAAGVALAALVVSAEALKTSLLLFAGLGAIAGKIRLFASTLRTAGIGAALMAVGLSPVALIVLAVVAAVALLAGGMVLLYTRNERFRAFVHEKLLPALERLGGFVRDQLLAALEAFAAFFVRDLLPTLEAAGGGIARFAGWIRDRLGNVLAWGREHWATLEPILTAPLRLAGIVIRQILDGYASAFRIVLAIIRGDWEGAWDIFEDYAGRTVERVREAVGGRAQLHRGAGLGARPAPGVALGPHARAAHVGLQRRQGDGVGLRGGAGRSRRRRLRRGGRRSGRRRGGDPRLPARGHRPADARRPHRAGRGGRRARGDRAALARDGGAGDQRGGAPDHQRAGRRSERDRGRAVSGAGAPGRAGQLRAVQLRGELAVAPVGFVVESGGVSVGAQVRPGVRIVRGMDIGEGTLTPRASTLPPWWWTTGATSPWGISSWCGRRRCRRRWWGARSSPGWCATCRRARTAPTSATTRSRRTGGSRTWRRRAATSRAPTR